LPAEQVGQGIVADGFPILLVSNDMFAVTALPEASNGAQIAGEYPFPLQIYQ